MRRTTRRSIAVVPVAEDDVRSSVTSFSTRFSLPSFVKRVEKLTDDQINLIKRTGFGNLLLLPNHMLSKTLLVELMDRWDPEKLGFEIGSTTMSMTLMDVALILGLPVVGDPVILKEDEPFSDLEMEYGAAAISKRKISVSYLESRLDSLGGACSEDFVRTFLLFTLGILLFPNTSGKVDSRYLSFMQDLDGVCDLAWGAAVLEDMLMWLNKRKETGIQSMGGCLIFLQIWSYEHIDIARPELVDSYLTFPRVCRWENSKSHQRQWFANKFKELQDHQVVWELEPTPVEQTLGIVKALLRIQNDDYELPLELQSPAPNTTDSESDLGMDKKDELDMESPPNVEEFQTSTSSSDAEDHPKHSEPKSTSNEVHMNSPNANMIFRKVAALKVFSNPTTIAIDRDDMGSVDPENESNPCSNSKTIEEEDWRRSNRILEDENTKLKQENAALRERVSLIPVLEEQIAGLKDRIESLTREDQKHRSLAEEFDTRMSEILLDDTPQLRLPHIDNTQK